MPLKNNLGFSLIEITVSIGALGIISLGVMNLSKMQSQSTMGVQGTSDMAKTIAMIDSVVKNPALCTKNFKDQKLSSTSIDQLFGDDGEVIISENNTFGSGVYKIGTMEIGDQDPMTGKTAFTFSIIKNKNASGVNEISKSVYFYPTVDPATQEITDCYYGIKKKAESMLQRLCDNVYEGMDEPCDYSKLLAQIKQEFCTSKPWLTWDGVRCGLLDAGKSCGVKYAEGYLADGNLDCSTHGP
ncbi:MAG: hypothetical protein CME62_03860 [Halobacteriovoraceae bacterium]|nr:hypothetical protein [Halobacteriovoraceae bacterium]|tara:strand:+ start:24802 stop:25527 length:726 start_codon:yes stop_codon:yes gene_type:complete